MKYRDLVSYVNFALSIPFVAIKVAIISIPVVTTVLLSYFGYDKPAATNFGLTKWLADKINTVEKYWIYLWSILLNPVDSYRNYKKNKKVIKFLRENVNKDELKNSGMPGNFRNAVKKEGLWEVTLKTILMFSILPTLRHSFWNNPFLYGYKLYLTNQSTSRFEHPDNMCQIIYAYINDPGFILNADRNMPLHLDHIGFTPNYSNDVADTVINYDNYGLQIGSKINTLIALETMYKSPQHLLETIEQQSDFDNSIMSPLHPIYHKLEEEGIELINKANFDNENRYIVLDLVVPYDDYYHLVTGKVEANIRNNEIIEHPMLCLYHDGQIMTKTWSLIEGLFNDRVMKYLIQFDGLNKPDLK